MKGLDYSKLSSVPVKDVKRESNVVMILSLYL